MVKSKGGCVGFTYGGQSFAQCISSLWASSGVPPICSSYENTEGGFITVTQTNDKRSRYTKQLSNGLTHFFSQKGCSVVITRGVGASLNESFFEEIWMVTAETYPWFRRLRRRLECELCWRTAKCLCCCGGSWTWEEDYRWRLATRSVQGNSAVWKKTQALIFFPSFSKRFLHFCCVCQVSTVWFICQR